MYVDGSNAVCLIPPRTNLWSVACLPRLTPTPKEPELYLNHGTRLSQVD